MSLQTCTFPRTPFAEELIENKSCHSNKDKETNNL